MSDLERVSLIIPAYNEETRISTVLEAGLDTPNISEVIVVDDGSIDETAKVAVDYDVTLLQHDNNRGKGEAMHTGYILAKELGSSALVFLDADLHNITPWHVTSLVEPVIAHNASMTIGILERTRLQKAVLRRWGAFSGQRAIPIEAWEDLSVSDRHGFNVEAALNARARDNGTHRTIQRVELAGVTHTGQREKESNLLKAGVAYARIYGSALVTYARIAIEE